MRKPAHGSTFGPGLKAFVAALIIATAAAAAPRVADAEAVVTSSTFTLNFSSACAGEVISTTGTLHLVNRPVGPLPEHGSWSNATGVGLTTGTVYQVVSVSNLMNPPNDYLTHLTIVAPEADGPKATATLRGSLFGAVTEVITEHCL